VVSYRQQIGVKVQAVLDRINVSHQKLLEDEEFAPNIHFRESSEK
jgi:hypothetical protein